METHDDFEEQIKDLYEKLDGDPNLEKEFLNDEKKFLVDRGFDPEKVKKAIEKIHKDRIDDLGAVLKDQEEKLR